MAFCRRWLLIFCALVLGGGQLFAASSTREQRAYAAAITAFQTEMWSRAETSFDQFRKNYPKSTNAPEAVLLEAQAQFKQGKFTNSIALLNAQKSRAGDLTDQYVSWIGEVQFAGSNFFGAAETFASLAKDFPDSPLRLRAAVDSASARAQLGDWSQLAESLEDTNGVFARTAQLDAANELVSRGRLLLAQAKFALKD